MAAPCRIQVNTANFRIIYLQGKWPLSSANTWYLPSGKPLRLTDYSLEKGKDKEEGVKSSESKERGKLDSVGQTHQK